MPVQNLIEVSICVNGQPLVEYAAEQNQETALYTLSRFIESTTGVKFSVVVTFKAGFILKKAKFLCAHITFDGGSRYEMKLKSQDLKQKKGILSADAMLKLQTIAAFDEEADMWKRCEPAFGRLEFSESSTLQMTPKEVSKLATIHVDCFRGRSIPRLFPQAHERKAIPVMNKISEVVSKGGKMIKNNVVYEYGIPVREPSPKAEDFVPVEGARGTKYNFIFHYRSRELLQVLDFISRSPSPIPDASEMLERTEQMLQIEKKQHRDLQLENMKLHEELRQARALSQRTRSDKSGNDDAQTNNALVDRNSTKRFKSESKAGDIEDYSDDMCEIEPPAKKPRIMIDLTDDE